MTQHGQIDNEAIGWMKQMIDGTNERQTYTQRECTKLYTPCIDKYFHFTFQYKIMSEFVLVGTPTDFILQIGLKPSCLHEELESKQAIK